MSEPTPLLAPLKPAVIAPRLWNGRHFVVDLWQVVPDDQPVPAGGNVLVSLARWRKERAALLPRCAPVGIAATPKDVLERGADALDRIGAVTLAFPKFSDGRAYSTARRLREQWGYTGEIRATGDVLLDQIPLMLRCGFNAFEITNAATARALEAGAVPAVSRVYQPAIASTALAWRSRRDTAQASAVAAE